MTIQDAQPGTPIILFVADSCEFCGRHPWNTPCPKIRCGCGSTVTFMGIDQLDGKVVRRCMRCNAVEIWGKA